MTPADRLNLHTLAARMQDRVEAILERDGTEEAAVTGRGVGISYLFAKSLARALQEAANELDRRAAGAVELPHEGKVG